MPSIATLLKEATEPTLSVEFFPPKTEAGEAQLTRTLAELREAHVPLTFASVTYGAGGSTRERTRDLVVEMNNAESYPAMAHLTCVGHTKAELEALLDDYASAGIRNILALAGDPPADGSPARGDFTYALELVELIRGRNEGFSVGVAAHPELHPRSTLRNEDRQHLAAKLAIADFGVSQFFFDADHYFRMVEEVERETPGQQRQPDPPWDHAAHQPRWGQADDGNGRRNIPDRTSLLALEAASETDRPKIVIDAAVRLCRCLIDGGAPGLHLYSLNRSETVLAIIDELG
ncbi:MAG: methylenetetrahydrofolate reductase [Microthrixaceae bacterium]